MKYKHSIAHACMHACSLMILCNLLCFNHSNPSCHASECLAFGTRSWTFTSTWSAYSNYSMHVYWKEDCVRWSIQELHTAESMQCSRALTLSLFRPSGAIVSAVHLEHHTIVPARSKEHTNKILWNICPLRTPKVYSYTVQPQIIRTPAVHGQLLKSLDGITKEYNV